MIKREVVKIENALRVLLTEMVKIDFARKHGPDILLTATPFDLSKPVPTRLDVMIGRVVDQPIRGALKNAVRLLGEHLFDLSEGTYLMSEVIDRISQDPEHGGLYGYIADHAWDGIGNAEKGYWFC